MNQDDADDLWEWEVLNRDMLDEGFDGDWRNFESCEDYEDYWDGDPPCEGMIRPQPPLQPPPLSDSDIPF